MNPAGNLIFTSFGAEPIDPTYVRFRDGWTKWIIGKRLYAGLRWSPWQGEGDWTTYPLERFDYIDFGVVGPKSPLEHRWEFDQPPGYIWEWDGVFIPSWKLPELWAEVNQVYARVKTQRPGAVWNPYDGSWREMRARTPTPPVPGRHPTPPPVISELDRRLMDLARQYREGIITDEIYKLRALELTREYG